MIPKTFSRIPSEKSRGGKQVKIPFQNLKTIQLEQNAT